MGKNDGRVDLRDVARLAGVSLGSASRAINGSGASAQVRSKVEQAAAALGYRPNHAAQSLRSRASRTIGCLLPDIGNPLYAAVYRAMEDEFRARGYMLLLANGGNDERREVETLDMFVQRAMDAVILAPGNERSAELAAALRALPMPALVFDRELPAGDDTVFIDHASGVRHAVEHLLARGHRRIALVLWKGDTRPVRRRIQGYRAAYRGWRLPPPELVVQVEGVNASAFAEVGELLARRDRPTAILVQGTSMLESALRAIALRGLRIPADVSVIAIGDTALARGYEPPISVLMIDLADTARRMAAMVLSRMEAPGIQPRKERVPFEYIERASVAPRSR
jgi:LacI family transcriptional regulator